MYFDSDLRLVCITDPPLVLHVLLPAVSPNKTLLNVFSAEVSVAPGTTVTHPPSLPDNIAPATRAAVAPVIRLTRAHMYSPAFTNKDRYSVFPAFDGLERLLKNLFPQGGKICSTCVLKGLVPPFFPTSFIYETSIPVSSWVVARVLQVYFFILYMLELNLKLLPCLFFFLLDTS